MDGELTSEVTVRSSSHINLGRMFSRNVILISVSTISSSASLGCSGNDAGEVLQVFIAHVKKFMVRSFIVAEFDDRNVKMVGVVKQLECGSSGSCEKFVRTIGS